MTLNFIRNSNFCLPALKLPGNVIPPSSDFPPVRSHQTAVGESGVECTCPIFVVRVKKIVATRMLHQKIVNMGESCGKAFSILPRFRLQLFGGFERSFRLYC